MSTASVNVVLPKGKAVKIVDELDTKDIPSFIMLGRNKQQNDSNGKDIDIFDVMLRLHTNGIYTLKMLCNNITADWSNGVYRPNPYIKIYRNELTTAEKRKVDSGLKELISYDYVRKVKLTRNMYMINPYLLVVPKYFKEQVTLWNNEK